MTCARANVWLQHYLDGRLDVRRLARLEEHLESCEACRADLMLLEIVCQAAVGEPVQEPAGLTAAIMGRIAVLEDRRAAAAGWRMFAPGWGDAVLAAALATAATAMFMVFQPSLWQSSSAILAQTLAPAGRTVADVYAIASAWLAWLVWVGAGILLTLWFAGGEVRATWRRTLLSRLPH